MQLFHGTSATFKSFSLDEAARPGMSSNGHLGVWLAVEADLAERFGSRCLTVEATFDRIHALPIGMLSRMNRDARRLALAAPEDPDEAEKVFYIAQRETFLDQGIDALALTEIDGRCDMMIALRPERLKIVAVHDVEPKTKRSVRP